MTMKKKKGESRRRRSSAAWIISFFFVAVNEATTSFLFLKNWQGEDTVRFNTNQRRGKSLPMDAHSLSTTLPPPPFFSYPQKIRWSIIFESRLYKKTVQHHVAHTTVGLVNHDDRNLYFRSLYSSSCHSSTHEIIKYDVITHTPFFFKIISKHLKLCKKLPDVIASGIPLIKKGENYTKEAHPSHENVFRRREYYRY
jgi:hypothetical protein